MPERGERRGSVPASTYRLQLHARFTFDDARAVLPYLHDLGITHVYLSPIAAAVPGSMHGYDVIDPTRINPELGGEAAYARLVAEQRRLGMGQLLDIVPNHMGVAASMNAWWEDVLRHGRASAYADVFDIDWEPHGGVEHGKVLLPILGDELDAVIARGEIVVERDADGTWARYDEHRLPLSPESAAALPPDLVPPSAPETVRDLLARQHYRLEYWRTGKARVNYRRFFLIDDLVALRVEEPAVFERVHALTGRLVREGAVDGLRVDHPDGLADPAEYLDRLAAAVEPSYVVLEKILEGDESLPAGWACDGTTGYDFMNDLTGVLLDAGGVDAVTRVYRQFTGDRRAYADVAYEARRAVVDGPLSRQIDARAADLWRAVAAQPPPGVDAAGVRETDADQFSEGVRALIAALPVYRTYHRQDTLDPRAPGVLAHARAVLAARAGARMDDRGRALAERVLAEPPPGAARAAVMRLQQLMPAAQAKGLEDAAFYRYVPLLALNEVGGAPDGRGLAPGRFHDRNRARRARCPRAMLASETHDHKRGEDVRARLAVLSELPDEWAAALRTWSALTARWRDADRDAPSRTDEYAFYQSLLGTWPPDAERPPLEHGERLRAYARKAAREAGERTDWLDPDADYEAALDRFIAGALSDDAFIAAARPLAARVARLGALNGLAQLVLKIAAPGVPDTYQGAEVWGLSLVDPDNRRPVDFGARRAALAALGDGPLPPGALGDLLAAWPDGRVKLFVLSRALRARRRDPALFVDGEYEPMRAIGERAEHVIAYARTLDRRVAIAVVPRLPAALTGMATEGRPWRPDWRGTALDIPPALAGATIQDLFSGRSTTLRATLPLEDVPGAFPVALLTGDRAHNRA
ncbi:MAG: malto-oligosyltrehalose synthase [Dehalococcoidia bacterium]